MEMEKEKGKSFQQEGLGVVPDWNHLLGLLQSGRAQPQPHLQFHFPRVPVTDQTFAIMHGEDVNGGVPAAPRWGSCETLESVVRQATCRDVPRVRPEDSRAHIRDCTGHRKVAKSLAPRHPPQVAPKRTRCESEPRVWRKKMTLLHSSASNARENNCNTIMATKLDEEESFSEDDDSENKDEDGEAARGETRRGNSQTQLPRQAKAAATHNLSEQRRRDRINEKMKALQKLVPNSNKTDKASMLDEVIAYTKQLQGQVEVMKLMRSSITSNNNSRSNNKVNIPQMMNAMMMPPTALPPHQLLLQMSLLARMGAGLGLGMLDCASIATANIPFTPPQQPPLPPHFLMPQMMPTASFAAGQLNQNLSGASPSMPMHDPYATFLAQMRMDDYYNKLASLHRQHIHRHARSDKTQRR